MKLRNKKTGEIMEGLELSVIEYGFGHEWMRDWSYNSIKAFLEDWEDVKENSPAEPLIKDEKIRKAVRVWASENIIEKAKFEYIAGTGSIFKDVIGGVEIGFYDDLKLTNRETYTITELCGEEE